MVVDNIVMIASFDGFLVIITNCFDRYGHIESNSELISLDMAEYITGLIEDVIRYCNLYRVTE